MLATMVTLEGEVVTPRHAFILDLRPLPRTPSGRLFPGPWNFVRSNGGICLVFDLSNESGADNVLPLPHLFGVTAPVSQVVSLPSLEAIKWILSGYRWRRRLLPRGAQRCPFIQDSMMLGTAMRLGAGS